MVRRARKAARFLAKISSAMCWLRARKRGGASAPEADGERAAAAVLWRFALARLQVLGSRRFLAWQLHESICVRFSPSPGSEAWPPTGE